MLSAEERALEREAKKGMNEEEAVFSVESALEQTYEWSDKYRPRKPRYGAGGGGGGGPDWAGVVWNAGGLGGRGGGGGRPPRSL